jgi:hypothetical protein
LDDFIATYFITCHPDPATAYQDHDSNSACERTPVKQLYSSLVPRTFVAVTGLVSEPDPGTVQEGKRFEAIIVVLHPVIFVCQGCCRQMK